MVKDNMWDLAASVSSGSPFAFLREPRANKKDQQTVFWSAGLWEELSD
jgi:hypothetical protein